jgi:nucleotide-binding universal stress UspA family protein
MLPMDKAHLIVVTTDLSPESKRVFAPARALCKKLGAKLHLIAVLEDLPFEPTGGGLMAVFPDRRQVKEDWEKALAGLADELGRDLCKEATVIDAVDVPRAIVEWAKTHGADFIAMATHGRSGLRRLLLGSVAEQVIRHSHVPVIIFPPPA